MHTNMHNTRLFGCVSAQTPRSLKCRHGRASVSDQKGSSCHSWSRNYRALASYLVFRERKVGQGEKQYLSLLLTHSR